MKNLAASVLARLAQRRAKTGEDFNVLLVRFALERLLYRLCRSTHREQFILKGAMLFALWAPTLHRVTRDLDLLGFGHPSADRLTGIFREFCRMEVEADGVEFDPRSVVREDIRAQDEYAGIRVKLRASIGKAMVPLQVDVGFGDALPVAPEEVTFPVLLGMAAPRLQAYSLEFVPQNSSRPTSFSVVSISELALPHLQSSTSNSMVNRFRAWRIRHYDGMRLRNRWRRLASAVINMPGGRAVFLSSGGRAGISLFFSASGI